MLDKLIMLSRFKFALLIALFAVIFSGIVLLSSYGIYRKSLDLVVNESMGEEYLIARTGANMADRLTNSIRVHLESLGQLDEIQNPGNHEKSFALEMTYRLLRRYVLSLSLVDMKGNIMAGYQESDQPIDDGRYEEYGGAIAECLEAGTVIVTRQQFKKNGERRILITCPVERDAENGAHVRSGMLVAEVDPQVMLDILGDFPAADASVKLVVVDGAWSATRTTM
jgi:hypothetical protein